MSDYTVLNLVGEVEELGNRLTLSQTGELSYQKGDRPHPRALSEASRWQLLLHGGEPGRSR